MNIETLQVICNKLPGVTEDIKWGDHLCFNLGDKMFLVTSPDHVPHTASFKVDDEEFEETIARDGFEFHKYLGGHKWVALDDINRLNKKEWEHFIKKTHQLVASKLSAKLRKQLGL